MNLTVRGLRAAYGSSEVLFGVDMHVEPGETVALIGRNGAGKTTTLQCVMGALDSREGSIEIDGAETIGLPAHRIARLGVALVPQGRRVFSELTVEENLRTAIRHRRGAAERARWSVERLYEIFPMLAKVKKSKGAWLSGGEQQVLSISRALLTEPRMLLLDEPTEGLAPRVVETLTEQLLQIKASGLTIVLAEQHLGLVRELAGRAYAIDRGLVRAEGDPASLLADEKIRHAYLSL